MLNTVQQHGRHAVSVFSFPSHSVSKH